MMGTVNTHCPWSGEPVASQAETDYRGHRVGFCRAGCRDKFNAAIGAFDRAIMHRNPLRIRPFGANDIPALLKLMKELAAFEGYEGAFAVTERDLHTHGLGPAPSFSCLVAETREDKLVGYAVTYGVPWTYDLKPRWVLKELFVSEGVRSSGIGNKLFEAVTAAAAERGATRIDWTVLPQNERAKAFYRARGGKPDAAWENWTLALSSGAVVGQ